MTCKAKTSNGQPCKAAALKGSRYCFTHDPANGQARAKARKLGGQRNRTPHNGQADQLPQAVTTVQEAIKILDYALAETIPLENSIARSRVLIALVAGYVQALQAGETEQRLAALETALRLRK